MARLVKLNGRRLGEDPNDIAVFLLTFTHASLDKPIRLTTDPTEVLSHEPYQCGTVSRGGIFDYVLIEAVLPDDRESGVASTTLSIANIDREIGQVMRSITGTALLKIEIVEATAPDYVLDYYDKLEVLSSTITDVVVQVEVGRPSYSTDAYPKGRMTWERLPGILR